jgi:two-component system, LytTR family, response regulator AlgR
VPKLRTEELRPDVVVLDLAMPDLDGLETATFMTACDPAVPIVLFTILGVEGIEGQAKAAGIRAIVPKTEAWSLIPRRRPPKSLGLGLEANPQPSADRRSGLCSAADLVIGLSCEPRLCRELGRSFRLLVGR